MLACDGSSAASSVWPCLRLKSTETPISTSWLVSPVARKGFSGPRHWPAGLNSRARYTTVAMSSLDGRVKLEGGLRQKVPDSLPSTLGTEGRRAADSRRARFGARDRGTAGESPAVTSTQTEGSRDRSTRARTWVKVAVPTWRRDRLPTRKPDSSSPRNGPWRGATSVSRSCAAARSNGQAWPSAQSHPRQVSSCSAVVLGEPMLPPLAAPRLRGIGGKPARRAGQLSAARKRSSPSDEYEPASRVPAREPASRHAVAITEGPILAVQSNRLTTFTHRPKLAKGEGGIARRADSSPSGIIRFGRPVVIVTVAGAAAGGVARAVVRRRGRRCQPGHDRSAHEAA